MGRDTPHEHGATDSEERDSPPAGAERQDGPTGAGQLRSPGADIGAAVSPTGQVPRADRGLVEARAEADGEADPAVAVAAGGPDTGANGAQVCGGGEGRAVSTGSVRASNGAGGREHGGRLRRVVGTDRRAGAEGEVLRRDAAVQQRVLREGVSGGEARVPAGWVERGVQLLRWRTEACGVRQHVATGQEGAGGARPRDNQRVCSATPHD